MSAKKLPIDSDFAAPSLEWAIRRHRAEFKEEPTKLFLNDEDFNRFKPEEFEGLQVVRVSELPPDVWFIAGEDSITFSNGA